MGVKGISAKTHLNKLEKLGWPNLVRQSAAVGLLRKDEKLRPTYVGSNPAPSF